MPYTTLILASSLLFAIGCSTTTGDAGHDAGTPTDAGRDSGATDAGMTDGGTTDAATTDAGAIDSGMTDAGTDDAGSVDAGGGVDAMAQDAGGDPTSCPPGEHLCVCATGHYCLFLGGACIAPSAPCP